TTDQVRTSRRLAEAYFNGGSFALAMQECEAVLAAEPGSPEMLAMLGEIEAKVPRGTRPKPGEPKHGPVTTGAAVDGGLLEIGGRNLGKPLRRTSSEDLEEGNEQLAKFLIVQQMFSEDEVQAGLAEVKTANQSAGDQLAVSLLDRLCNGNEGKM